MPKILPLCLFSCDLGHGQCKSRIIINTALTSPSIRWFPSRRIVLSSTYPDRRPWRNIKLASHSFMSTAACDALDLNLKLKLFSQTRLEPQPSGSARFPFTDLRLRFHSMCPQGTPLRRCPPATRIGPKFAPGRSRAVTPRCILRCLYQPRVLLPPILYLTAIQIHELFSRPVKRPTPKPQGRLEAEIHKFQWP